jgi:hypothetical protein
MPFHSFKMIERIAEVLRIDPTELFATKNYPVEPSSAIREDLINRFDQFLRATVIEIREGKQGK